MIPPIPTQPFGISPIALPQAPNSVYAQTSQTVGIVPNVALPPNPQTNSFMVFTNEDISMEELRAELPKYKVEVF
jgi:hypothetical protein